MNCVLKHLSIDHEAIAMGYAATEPVYVFKYCVDYDEDIMNPVYNIQFNELCS